MQQWAVISTPEFEGALAKLPSSDTVADTIAELMVRLEFHAGEGDRVADTDWWVIRSAAQASRPGIHILYALHYETRQVRLIDVQLVPEAPRATPWPDEARP